MKTISEVFPLFIEFKRQFVKLSTASSYHLIYENHVRPSFGEKTGPELNEKVIQDFVIAKSNENKLSSKSIRDVLIVIKMILKYGNKNSCWPVVDTDWKIIYPKEAKKERQIKTMEQKDQQKLFDYILGHFTTRNFGIYLTLFTGMRIGEVCALQWKHIDTEAEVIRVRKTIERIYIIENGKRYTKVIISDPKTESSIRDIPIASQLMKLVKPMKKLVNPEFFVLGNEEKAIEPRTYRNYFSNLLKKLNIPNLNYHGLRHTFATRCLESKADIKTVSSILGHSDIGTTMNLYMHPDSNMKKNAIEKMGKLFK